SWGSRQPGSPTVASMAQGGSWVALAAVDVRIVAPPTAIGARSCGVPAYSPIRRCPARLDRRFGVAFPTEVVMLPSYSRGLRLALLLALGAGYVAWVGH